MNKKPDRYTLFVSSLLYEYGGISDYTDNFAQQLQKRNRLQRVISPYHGDIVRDYEVSTFHLGDFRKPTIFDKWVISRKMVTFLYYARTYLSVYRELRELDLHKTSEFLIFTEYYTFQFDIIIFCARLLKIKYGIVFHGLDLLVEKSHRFAHFSENFRKAEFIIYNSEATKQLAVGELGLRHDHTMILNPGMDIANLESYLNPEDCLRGFRNNKDEIIFATISRLVKRKGIDKAIRMVVELAKEGIAARYFIGGSGAEMDRTSGSCKRVTSRKVYLFPWEYQQRRKI